MKLQQYFIRIALISAVLPIYSINIIQAEDLIWPQFRGPKGLGIAQDDQTYPAELDKSKNLLWEIEIPKGHSSPCIWGDKIFITAYENGKLETICIDRIKGQLRWSRSVEPESLEKIHGSNSHASPTPTCDGERVYVYFGSFGLLAYDMDGKELWKKPLPIPNIRYGSGASPILVNNMVVINSDSEKGGAYIFAVDRYTGETVWRQERQVNQPGWSTPVLWKHENEQDLVVRGQGTLISYDLKDGHKRWWLNNLPKGGDTVPSPVYAGDTLFVIGSEGMTGDPVNPIDLPDFTELLKRYDKDNDGHLVKAEIPEDLAEIYRYGPQAAGIIENFSDVDTDKDDTISEAEWENIVTDVRNIAPTNLDALVAIRAGGTDDISRTHVKWTAHEGIGQVPSPLFYKERIYLVKHGGNVTCYNAKTGRKIYGDKTGVRAYYFASPVAADNKIYFCSLLGDVFVVQVGDEFRVLSHNKIGEDIYATPALVNGNVYLRTEKKMYAFINSEDDSDRTPSNLIVQGNVSQSKTLYEATVNGDIELVKTLISSGADINTPNNWGWTPLHGAAVVGNKDMVDLLISKGADINNKNNDGLTPLHLTVLNDQADVVEILITKGADIEAKNNNGLTPLHFAARDGQKEIVELLISKRADIEAKNNNGLTPLHFAARDGQKDVVEMLITKGADKDATDNLGRTPLHLAAVNGQADVAEMLITKGADKDAADNLGRTPLHLAARSGQKEIVELLITKGVDINATNYLGVTPLLLAMRGGYTEIVELLKEHGAKE